MLLLSRCWKKWSGFSAIPRITGAFGFNARARNSANACWSISGAKSSFSNASIFWISCDVRNPSKKLTKGTRDLMVAKCATPAKSITSWTEPSANIAKPVWRHAITSWWSPKIHNACDANVRADTWNTQGNNSPAILYILGIISNKPCDAV